MSCIWEWEVDVYGVLDFFIDIGIFIVYWDLADGAVSKHEKSFLQRQSICILVVFVAGRLLIRVYVWSSLLDLCWIVEYMFATMRVGKGIRISLSFFVFTLLEMIHQPCLCLFN
jgi:hypothetical protein